MRPGKSQEIWIIKRNVTRARFAILGYIHGGPPSRKQRAALLWVRLRIAVVCRYLYHDNAHTNYELSRTERAFFLGVAQYHLSGRIYEEISIIDAVLWNKVNGRDLDSLVYGLTAYLETIEKECEIAECTNTLPKEVTFDVEY